MPLVTWVNKSDFCSNIKQYMCSQFDCRNGKLSSKQAQIQISYFIDITKKYSQALSSDQPPCNKRMGKCTVKYIGTSRATLLHHAGTANLSTYRKHSWLYYWFESWSFARFVPQVLSSWNDFPTKINHKSQHVRINIRFVIPAVFNKLIRVYVLV